MKYTFWALFETISTIGFQFLSLIVLSRILKPSDYGILGMMAIFIAIGNMLADSGLGGAIVKKKDATNLDYSTLFCFNFAISLLFYLLLFLCSGSLAVFYNVEELADSIKIYGLFVVISSLGIVQNTRLVKELRFRDLAIISFFSNLIAFLIAFYGAKKGWGYWSLIIQHLVFISLRVLGQFVVNRYVPVLRFSKKSFMQQWNFGGHLLFSNILHTIYGNIVSSIVPKMGTITQNGYYVQASKIHGVPVSVITMVSDKLILPILSKQHTLETCLGKARKIMKIAIFSSYACITICVFLSKFAVYVLLGEQWLQANEYLQILFLSAYGTCFVYIEKNIIKSIGETKEILKIEMYKSIIGLVLIIVSSFWGIIGILWGVFISSLLAFVASALVTHKSTAYKVSFQWSDCKYAFIFPLLSFFYVILIS